MTYEAMRNFQMTKPVIYCAIENLKVAHHLDSMHNPMRHVTFFTEHSHTFRYLSIRGELVVSVMARPFLHRMFHTVYIVCRSVAHFD